MQKRTHEAYYDTEDGKLQRNGFVLCKSVQDSAPPEWRLSTAFYDNLMPQQLVTILGFDSEEEIWSACSICYGMCQTVGSSSAFENPYLDSPTYWVQTTYSSHNRGSIAATLFRPEWNLPPANFSALSTKPDWWIDDYDYEGVRLNAGSPIDSADELCSEYYDELSS